MPIFNYLFKSLWRNKRRTLSILLGITVASSLIIGINLSMDAMGTEMLAENFEQQAVDVSITTNRAFFGNFSHFTTFFDDCLRDDYSEIMDIFGAIRYESYSTAYSHGQAINWSYYEQSDFDWQLFEHTIFYGIKPDLLNHQRMQEIIQFESTSGTFTPADNEVFIENTIALQNNLTIGENITIGNYFYTWYPEQANFTYSVENLTVAGFFNILDERKFNSLFPENYVWSSDETIQVLTSENLAFELLTGLWNNISNFNLFHYGDYWHIAIILDHSNFDYLHPEKIEVFYNRLMTDIVYAGINSIEEYDFIVTAHALNLLEGIKADVVIFKLIASLVSIPVLLLAWILLSTNYHVIFNNRRREIGLLKTRFFTNAKLRRLYFSESTIFGLLGGITGSGFGLLSAWYIYSVFSKNTSFFTLITLRSFFTSALSGIILGTVLSLISSIKPTLTFSKLKTIDSLQKYNIEIQTRPLRIRWWDWLLLIFTSLSIIFSIILDPELIFNGPFIWEMLLYILMPFFSVLLPLSPFILSWVIAKFFSTYSLGFFTKAISTVTRIFNKKTDFFVTRSITRNRWRSTRIVAIISIALSFLIIADITTSTEIQFQKDSIFIKTGGDAAFKISTANLTREEVWSYVDTLMSQGNLSISHSSIISKTSSFSRGYGWLTYIDLENYSSHVGTDIDRFIGGNTNQLFAALNSTPKGVLVPQDYIKWYEFEVGDHIFINYFNNTNSSAEITQELEIVGVYDQLPGQDFYSSYYSLICKDVLPFFAIDSHTWMVNYNYDSDNFNELNKEIVQEMKNLNPSIIIRSVYNTGEDEIFSLLTFLGIEKYYFLILVAIGIAITMYNSIQEKSLDFGLLRARGVEKWTIIKTQLSEGLVLLTLGAIISLNGILSAWALNNAIDYIIGFNIPRTLSIPIWRILIEMGASILLFSLIIIVSSLFILKQSNVKKISEVFRTA